MNAKYIAAIALTFVFIAGLLAVKQHNSAAELKLRIEKLTAELREKDKKSLELAADLARLRRERESRKLDNEEVGSEAVPPDSELDSSPTAVGSAASYESAAELFRRTLSDPQIRERERQRQRFLGRQVYADFVKARQLTPDQAEMFFDLVADREMHDLDDALNLFTSGLEDGDTVTINARAASQWAEKEQELRGLLTESGYASYQEYNKTLSERVTLAQIRQELAGNTQPLREDQANFLLQVLLDERSRTPPTAFDPRGPGRTREKYRVAVEAENAEQYLEAQSSLDERVLVRAKTILDPEQYEALASFQRQHFQTEASVIELARKAIAQQNTSALTH